MMGGRIPLGLRIKRKMHKEIAFLQDIIVERLYEIFPKAVIHGGAAIWRCYNGNRFSEDIDVYIERKIAKLNLLFENLQNEGFKIIKKRIKENSLFSVLRFNDVEVRLEGIFKKVQGIPKEYETVEGTLITVYTLPPETLIKEKIKAYLKRRKIRDLYDIFFLLRFVVEKEKIKKELKALITSFKKPSDEEELRTLILYGIAPSSKEIIEYLRRWLR